MRDAVTADETPDRHPPPIFPVIVLVTALLVVLLLIGAVGGLLCTIEQRTRDYWLLTGDFAYAIPWWLAAVGISVLLVIVAAVRLLLRRHRALAGLLSALVVLLVTVLVGVALVLTCVPLYPLGSNEACYIPMPGAKTTPPHTG
jgi:hypothetical protein